MGVGLYGGGTPFKVETPPLKNIGIIGSLTGSLAEGETGVAIRFDLNDSDRR